MKKEGFLVNEIDGLVERILNQHLEEIRNVVVNTILYETADVILDVIYREINSGKIRLEGVLRKEDVYKAIHDKFENIK